MPNIELLVSVPGRAEPILVPVAEDARVVEVIEIVKSDGNAALGDAEQVFLFQDGADEALGSETRLNERGVGHRHHLHAYRCHHIDVTVSFDGSFHSRPFAPSTRVEQVRDWAVDVFAAPTETAAYAIAEGQKRLSGDTHLRAVTHHSHLRLDLVHEELTIHYTVNAEAQVAHERHRTPHLILEKADLDPSKYYLKHGSVSYKDMPDQSIPLRDGEAFTAIYSGGGTVS